MQIEQSADNANRFTLVFARLMIGRALFVDPQIILKENVQIEKSLLKSIMRIR